MPVKTVHVVVALRCLFIVLSGMTYIHLKVVDRLVVERLDFSIDIHVVYGTTPKNRRTQRVGVYSGIMKKDDRNII